MKHLTASELEKLLAATRRAKYRHRDRLCLLLMARLGLRESEVCGLDWAHYHPTELAHGAIDLVDCKHGSDRTLPLTREVRAALDAWSDDPRRVDGPAIVSTRTGSAIHRNQIIRLVGATAKRAGIRHVHPHMLRHTAAVDLLDRPGAVLTDATGMLGHKRASTTAIYLHARPARLAGLLEG